MALNAMTNFDISPLAKPFALFYPDPFPSIPVGYTANFHAGSEACMKHSNPVKSPPAIVVPD